MSLNSLRSALASSPRSRMRVRLADAVAPRRARLLCVLVAASFAATGCGGSTSVRKPLSADPPPTGLRASTPQTLDQAAGASLSTPVLVGTSGHVLTAVWGRGQGVFTATLSPRGSQWVQGPSVSAANASGASVVRVAARITPQHTVA